MKEAVNILRICNLRIGVHLGCSSQERFNIQPVHVNIKIIFKKKLPRGVYTDNVQESICYTEIVKLVEIKVSSKSFKLIEHLAAFIYSHVFLFIESKYIYTNSFKVKVKVIKICAPVIEVIGEVSFEYSGPTLCKEYL